MEAPYHLSVLQITELYDGQNLEHQQNLKRLDLGVVILQARSNAYPVVAPLVPKVNGVSKVIQAGQVVHING